MLGFLYFLSVVKVVGLLFLGCFCLCFVVFCFVVI